MPPLIGLSSSTVNNPGGSSSLMSGVNRSYTDWITRAGGVPVLLPNTTPEGAPRMLAALDGILFTGGYDISPVLYGAEPARHLGTIDVPRDQFELPLARLALADGLPILGICRGLQMLNVTAGGTLRQDLNHDPTATVQHQMTVVGGTAVHHTVNVTPGSRLAGILGVTTLATNSYHHQAVLQLGSGLQVVAQATDGTVEAIEGAGERFLVAVQWHPEVMATDHEPTAKLFAAFVDAAMQGASQAG